MARLLVLLPPEERAALDRWDAGPDFTSTDEWPGWEKYRKYLGPPPEVRRLRAVKRRRQ